MSLCKRIIGFFVTNNSFCFLKCISLFFLLSFCLSKQGSGQGKRGWQKRAGSGATKRTDVNGWSDQPGSHLFGNYRLPLPSLVGPNNLLKNASLCFIIAIWIIKPLSIPQQTIFLSLHMVINHEITIFDISWFLFATLTFWVVNPRHGSNGPVYPIKRRSFIACNWVQRTHARRKRV